jgi:hypothetical protein
MNKYRCSICKKSRWTTRKEARKCVCSHIKTNKENRDKKREKSNITEKMETKDFEERK